MKVKKWKMKKNAALALAVILMATGMDFPVYAEETNTAGNQVVAENQEATVSPGDGESNEIMMTSLLAEEIHTLAPGEIKEIDGRDYTAGADGARVAEAYDDELYLGYFVSVLEGEVETVIEDSESLCIAYPDGEGGYTNLEKLTIDANGARACVLGEERNFISIKADDVLTREEVYGHETTEVRTYEYFPEQDMESSVGLIFREGKVTIDPDSLLGGDSLDGYLRVTAPKGTTDVLEGIDWVDGDGDGSVTADFGVEGDMILKAGVIFLRSDNSPAIRIKDVATYGITVSGNDMGVNALIHKDDSFAAGLVDGTALISMGPAGENSFAMYGDPGEPLLVMSDGTVQPASQFSYDENGIYVAYGVFEHVSGNPEITLHIENDSTPAVTIGNNTEFVAYNIQNRGYIMGSGTLTCDEGISTYVIDGEAYKVTGVTMTGYAAFTEEDGVLVAANKSVVSVVSKDDGEKTCTVKVEPDPNPYVIYVGGVGMRNGEYLANGATSSSSSKPASGGYAYIKDNTLTLNNYSYVGPGYLYEPFYDEEEGAYYNYTAALYSDFEAVLNVILEGENSLANTDSLEDNCLGHGMAAKGGLNIGGNGSLTIDSSQDGIFTDNEGVTVGGACVLEFSCGDDGICTFCDLKLCENCDVTLNAGDDGLDGAEVEITGNSKLTVYSDSDGIYTDGDITIGGSSKIYIEADSDGIYSEEGNITIGGNSDVYVLVGSDGIETYGSIFISGDCTLKLYADDDGIAGGVQITDATVTIDAYDDGIDAYDEDIIITNSELIIRNAESGFENTQGDIIIDNSTVDILDVYCGIDCNNTGVTIRGNSTLEICDAQYGVYANRVAISDSTVRVTADDRAFVVYDSFDIAAGLSVMVPDGGVCGLYEEVDPAFQTILNEDGSLATSVLIAAECDHECSDYYVYTGEGEKAPTCTKSGLGHKECTKCGTVMESGIVVNALGHDYRAEVTTEATTEKEGVRTYTCDNCGDSYTEKIPKLPKPTATPEPTPKPTATPEPTIAPVVTPSVEATPAPVVTPTPDFIATLTLGSDGNWYSYINGAYDPYYKGLAQLGEAWWMVVNGTIDFTYTSPVFFDDNWWFVRDGLVEFDYNGLVFVNDDWWYVVNGRIDFGFNGLAFVNDAWWYVSTGRIDFSYTGLIFFDDDWWFVQNGCVNFGYTGLAFINDDWWYVVNGRIDFGYCGLFDYDNQKWYVQGGKIDFSYNNVYYFNDIWWYIETGKVNFAYNGLAYTEFNDKWWYVINGVISFDYTGAAYANEKYWYVERGEIDFQRNGKVTIDGVEKDVAWGEILM